MKMKRIGIVTQIRVYNYGTRLQAYAMQEIFRSRGFYTEILVLERKTPLSLFIYRIKAFLYLFFKKSLNNIRYRKYIRTNYPKLSSNWVVNSIRTRLLALDRFNKLLNYSVLTSEEALVKKTENFDVVVCGSDQMWRPFGNNDLKFKMLRCVSQNVRKISYAPSLGVNTMPEESKAFFRDALKDFYSISVRETSGAELLCSLTEKHVFVVLDPTLLIGRKVWDKILKEKTELMHENYCLCYFLGTNSRHRKIANEISKKQHLTIYNFSHFKEFNTADNDLEGLQLYDVSPAEFIGLISKAKFVITDSLHCTIFSLMYHIPFLTLQRYNNTDELSTNNRIFSLLKQFGLESRILQNWEKTEEILTESIDFENVEKILLEKRKVSNAYLDIALENL